MTFSSFLGKKIFPGSSLSSSPKAAAKVRPKAGATVEPKAPLDAEKSREQRLRTLAKALDVISAGGGLFNDYSVMSPEKLASAWQFVNRHYSRVANYARAHVSVGVNMRLRGKKEPLEEWRVALRHCLDTESDIAINAIKNGADITATDYVTDLIADDTIRIVGDEPKLDLTAIGVVKRKVHITDGGKPARPLFPRLFKTQGDKYLRAESPSAESPSDVILSIATVERSGWAEETGWLKYGTTRPGWGCPGRC